MNLTGTNNSNSNDISLNNHLNKNSIYMPNGIKPTPPSQLTLNQNGNVLMKHSPSSSLSSGTNINSNMATGTPTSATMLFNSLDSALLSDGNGQLQNNHIVHHGNSNSVATVVAAAAAANTTATTNIAANHNSPNKRAKERENLRNIIAQWNANRLDLFEISEPNEVGYSCCCLFSKYYLLPLGQL